jgi:P27 family predicted phage terminase small subunit
MAGKRQKPRNMLRTQRPDRMLAVPIRLDVGRKPPTTPAGLHQIAQKAWRDFWASDVSYAVDLKADLGALRRWAHCLSERARFSELVELSPLVKGSAGQLRRNPLVDHIALLNAEITRYEDHFGMTPLARMRLGIASAGAEVGRLVVAERRAMVEADAGEYADPRDALRVLS